jgi:esterase/lipase superfamily enzyme
MTSKLASRWYSERLERDVNVVRWGEHGRPVLVFPTAGGDAEEIERFHLVGACRELLDAGRVKIYSVDSVNGRVMLAKEGDAGRQAWIQRQFFEFVRHELVPAVRADCSSPDIEMLAAGASIGAFNALACVCLHPDVFRAAIGMSGTYDLRPFFHGRLGDDFASSSPLEFVPGLGGDHLDMLRGRMVILASGEGENENIGESWRIANVLGEAGIPNRVDSWGAHWPHDWPLWRAMLPGYLDDLVEP